MHAVPHNDCMFISTTTNMIVTVTKVYVFIDRSTVSLDGINPAHRRCIDVTFNVILPVKHWLWDDTCTLSLRFGHKKLGDWDMNVGKFTLHR